MMPKERQDANVVGDPLSVTAATANTHGDEEQEEENEVLEVVDGEMDEQRAEEALQLFHLTCKGSHKDDNDDSDSDYDSDFFSEDESRFLKYTESVKNTKCSISKIIAKL